MRRPSIHDLITKITPDEPREFLDGLFLRDYQEEKDQIMPEKEERSFLFRILVKAAQMPLMHNRYEEQLSLFKTIFDARTLSLADEKKEKPHEDFKKIFDAIFKPYLNAQSGKYNYLPHQEAIANQLKKFRIHTFHEKEKTFDDFITAREKFFREYDSFRDDSVNDNSIPYSSTTLTYHPITSVTTSATPDPREITAQMIFKTLWGDENKDNPAADSVCGKMLATWNEKQTSPALIPPPEFMFIKPELKNIIVEDNGKNIEINLVAKHQAKTDVHLNLTRQVNDEKNLETWTCQSTDNLISEKMQFELIATEAFALREAQEIENAEIIGIMPLEEDGKIKNESAQFCQQNGKPMLLSVREEALIEAHIKAGFTVTYGKNEIKKIEIDNAKQPTV